MTLHETLLTPRLETRQSQVAVILVYLQTISHVYVGEADAKDLVASLILVPFLEAQVGFVALLESCFDSLPLSERTIGTTPMQACHSRHRRMHLSTRFWRPAAGFTYVKGLAYDSRKHSPVWYVQNSARSRSPEPDIWLYARCRFVATTHDLHLAGIVGRTRTCSSLQSRHVVAVGIATS